MDFSKYIPTIDSPLKLIALALVLVVILVKIFFKSSIIKLLEKKFTREQSYKAFTYIIIGLFIIAIVMLGFAYFKATLDYNAESRKQTIISINNKDYEILKINPKESQSVELFTSSSPPFVIPLGNKNTWYLPINFNDKNKIKDLFDFDGFKDLFELLDSTPFFKVFKNSSGYIIPSKNYSDLLFDSETTASVHDYFNGDTVIQPFVEKSLKQKARSSISILITNRMTSNEINAINFSNYCASFISNLISNPKQLIITKSRMHASVETTFNKAIVHGVRMDITISKYYAIIKSNNYMYIVEGVYFSTDNNPTSKLEVANSVFNFSTSKDG